MPPYQELFPAGSRVRIADLCRLENFKEAWKDHHPLAPEQLEYAGRSATVDNVGFYHGGDVLYELIDVPGTWHEECLEAAENS